MILDSLLAELQNFDATTASREQSLWAYVQLGLLAGATEYYPGLSWVEPKLAEINAAVTAPVTPGV